MPKAKTPKPEKPSAEMSEQERINDWRRKRAARGEIQKPKAGKKESK
jgi:hypothetical protein